MVWLCLRSGGVSIITSQFLRLEPGVQLRPHCGEGNFRWVMHLGLDVPSGVAITVGGKTVAWEEGKVILPTAPGVSSEGGVLPSWFPCRLFLGPGFRLGARWNRLVETVKTRKKRGKTEQKWARYGLKGVKEGS